MIMRDYDIRDSVIFYSLLFMVTLKLCIISFLHINLYLFSSKGQSLRRYYQTVSEADSRSDEDTARERYST